MRAEGAPCAVPAPVAQTMDKGQHPADEHGVGRGCHGAAPLQEGPGWGGAATEPHPCRRARGLGLVCSGSSWIVLQRHHVLHFLGEGILSFLSHSVVSIMPILSMGPSAKVNVCVVLKTYIISLWEPAWTETLSSPLLRRALGGRWRGKCFFPLFFWCFHVRRRLHAAGFPKLQIY